MNAFLSIKFLLVYWVLVAALYGCREFKQISIREFIPGTYIRYSVHEFGHEYDTIVITLQNETADQYSILRKWKYERVLDGVPLAPEYKQVFSTGYYHENKKLLEVIKSGEVYSFNPQQRKLFNGKINYQKL
jgi:hypothetical protein